MTARTGYDLGLAWDYSAWAMDRLFEVCEGLTPEQLEATAPGGFGTTKDTLWHIVRAQAGYASRLATGQRAPRTDDPPPSVAEMRKQFAESAALIADVIVHPRSFPIEVLGDNDEPLAVDPEVILAQVVHHAGDHRTQVNAILNTSGVEVPEFDAWAWGEATGKMRPR